MTYKSKLKDGIKLHKSLTRYLFKKVGNKNPLYYVQGWYKTTGM